MKQVWTQGLEDQLSKDVTQNYKESAVMRRRLRTILDGKIDDLHASACSKSLYDSPNWQFHQADKMGYERALRELIELIFDK